MTWDYPGFLAAALALPVIILLHLLARRRRSVVVPSLLLWERLLENERRSVSLRRLIADLLLVLQLLTAVLLILALAGPRPEGRRNRLTGPTVLVLDISAGMSAAEGPAGKGLRFDEAVKQAAELIRRKSAAAEVMLVAGGGEALPVTGFLASRSRLLAALKSLEPGNEAGDPRRTVKAAEALAAGRPDVQVVFITDAAFDDGPPDTGGTRVVRVGGPAENIGITAFAVRYLPGGGRELLVAVENHGSETRTVGLTVDAGELGLLAEELRVAPEERVVRTVSWNEPRAEEVSAVLELSLSDGNNPGDRGIDALLSDNRAAATLSPPGHIRTALFTPGNWFLETLLAAHPDISLTVFRDEAGGDPGFAEGSWDLVVADRSYPRTDIDAPILAIYPFPENPPLPLEPLGFSEDADPVFRDPGHPITRNLDLSRVTVRTALTVAAAPEARTLVSSSAGPLVMAGENERGRWVALTFDLLDSSLPLRPAFPILMSGAIGWLAGDNPDGAVQAYTGSNPLSSGESDLTPRWNPGSREETTESGIREARGFRTGREARSAGPLTTLLLVLALLSVLAEWGFQTRNWRKT